MHILHRAGRRITFANVVSVVALFIALGGTGYAVTALPDHSVGTVQLKNRAVTSTKIHQGAVTLADFESGVASSLHVVGGSVVGTTALPSGAIFDTHTAAVNFTLGRAGRVLVSASIDHLSGQCTGAGPCSTSAVLTIDGTPVPGAIIIASAGASLSDVHDDATISGISAHLAAGTHQIRSAEYYTPNFFAGSFGGASTYTILELG